MTPETQDAAAVVMARAHLERYREGVDPADLGAARDALGSVRTGVLEPRVRIEYLLAVGQALFLQDDFGAAAALFASGVSAAMKADEALGEAMLDWWGSAMERQAESSPPDRRKELFATLVTDMRAELARHPESAAACYWVAAGLRGAGDSVAAWDAATAGWVRARLAGRFEQQFVVHREDHPRARVRGSERRIDVDHRALEDVGRRALDGQVHGDALGGRAICPLRLVSSGTSRRRPNMRLDDAGAARLLERLIDVGAHARKAREVGVDELLRRLLRHADVRASVNAVLP
jgi:hypothetical protein